MRTMSSTLRRILFTGREGSVVLLLVAAWFLAVPVRAQILTGAYRQYHVLDGGGESSTLDGRSIAVAGVGDVNEDGFPDVIVGVPLADAFGIDSGSVFVYSGKDGTVIWQVHGSGGSRLGLSVAAAGDVDQDGFPDVVVGAPRGTIIQSDVGGSAFVYSGREGRQLWRFDGSVGPAGTGDLLGWSVAGAGDVNKDGFSDVIVGAPYLDIAYIYSGKDGQKLREFQGLPVGPTVAIDALGWSVAGAGDVNKDGFSDVIVGAPSAHAGGVWRGSAFVFSGKDGKTLWQFDGMEDQGRVGHCVAPAGDVNHDGFPDVIVGAPRGNFLGPGSSGSAFVYSGKDGTQLWRFDGTAGDMLGHSVAGAGDVDLDGFADLLVGAPRAEISRKADAGVVYLYSGRDGSQLSQIRGAVAGERMGLTVAGVGDVDEDGLPDMVVGSDGGTLGAPTAFLRVLKLTTFKRGAGVTGPFFVLTFGTAGEIPYVGNANFKIDVRWAPPGAPAVLAGSLAPADVSIAGVNLYGDYLTPGLFTTWGFVIDPIFGTAALPIPIPNDPALTGLITYWQWFVKDSASPLPIGLSYTHGLGIIIIE